MLFSFHVVPCSLPIKRRKKDLAKQVHEVSAFAMISVLLFMGMILRVFN